MKLSRNYTILLILAIVFGMTYLHMTQIENFQSTFETLFNLPPWVVYIFVFIFAIGLLAAIYINVAKWIYGYQTVGKVANTAGDTLKYIFGPKQNTVKQPRRNNNYESNSNKPNP